MAIEIKVDDVVVATISDTQIKILKSYINEDVLSAHIEGCISNMVSNKCADYAKMFQDEWIIKLQADPLVTSIPVASEDFVNLILARSDYKTQKQKETERI